MPEKFKDSINLPVAIPAWGLLSLLAGSIFTAGVMFQKMDMLLEATRTSESKIAVIQEKQAGSQAAISILQNQVQNHELRIGVLERNAIEAKPTR